MDSGVNTNGDSQTAAYQFLYFSELFEQSAARRRFLPNAVHIGADAQYTESKKRTLAQRVAHLTASGDVFDVVGSARSVYDRITDTRARLLASFPDVGLVTTAYFLHNYESDDGRLTFLRAIREQLEKSVMLCMDYTLNGLPDDEIMQLLDSNAEHVNLAQKSASLFLRQHRLFTLDCLRETFERSGWQYVSTAPMHAARGLVVAGAAQDPWESTGTDMRSLLREASERACTGRPLTPPVAYRLPSRRSVR